MHVVQPAEAAGETDADVFEIAQERPTEANREVAAEWRALGLECRDERLIEQIRQPAVLAALTDVREDEWSYRPLARRAGLEEVVLHRTPEGERVAADHGPVDAEVCRSP